MKNKYEFILSFQSKLKQALMGEHVVFHHVPKCGGTSLNRALRLKYFMSQRPIMANSTARTVESFFEEYEAEPVEFHRRVHLFRKQLLHYYLNADIAYITGHVGFCDKAWNKFNQRYRFVTVLRHPVDRFISDYLDLSVRKASYYQTDLSIEEYLDTDEAKIRAATLGLYFSSSLKSATGLDDDDYSSAAANLEKFDLVGFVDDMGGFNRRLNDLLRIRINIGHENRSQASGRDKTAGISQAARERIEHLCQRDVQLYETVRRSTGSGG